MAKYRNIGNVSINVDVDINDVIYELNESEKRDLFDILKEDLGIDNIFNEGEEISGTTTEQELFNICNKIYGNRNSLTDEDKVLLIKLSKKGWYEKVI